MTRTTTVNVETVNPYLHRGLDKQALPDDEDTLVSRGVTTPIYLMLSGAKCRCRNAGSIHVVSRDCTWWTPHVEPEFVPVSSECSGHFLCSSMVYKDGMCMYHWKNVKGSKRFVTTVSAGSVTMGTLLGLHIYKSKKLCKADPLCCIDSEHVLTLVTLVDI